MWRVRKREGILVGWVTKEMESTQGVKWRWGVLTNALVVDFLFRCIKESQSFKNFHNSFEFLTGTTIYYFFNETNLTDSNEFFIYSLLNDFVDTYAPMKREYGCKCVGGWRRRKQSRIMQETSNWFCTRFLTLPFPWAKFTLFRRVGKKIGKYFKTNILKNRRSLHVF